MSMLSERARAFEGRTVEFLTSKIGVVSYTPDWHIVRRVQAGERGVIESVSDAGSNGLVFWVLLQTGEHVNAYERGDVKVV